MRFSISSGEMSSTWEATCHFVSKRINELTCPISIELVLHNASVLAGEPLPRAAVERLTGELHGLADAWAGEAEHVLHTATRASHAGAKKGHAKVARLADEIARARRVIGQTARRLAGETTIPDRVVSLADLDARPIRNVDQMVAFG